MSDFINDKRCVTHHNTCDCREEHFRKLKKENDELKLVLTKVANWDFNIQGDCVADAQKLAKQALERNKE